MNTLRNMKTNHSCENFCFNSAYEINLYIANCIRKIDEEMKKEYMKKRVEKWCENHDCYLDILPSGVHCLSYHEGLIDTEFFPSLTKLYNYLFVDSEE